MADKLFDLDDSYKIKVEDIDAQHSRLVGHVNDLYAAMKRGEDKEAIGGILMSLLEYTNEHFSSEEELMTRIHYPGIDEHRKEHVAFRSRLEELHSEFKGAETGITVDLMLFLKDWVLDHVLNLDMKYAEFMKNSA